MSGDDGADGAPAAAGGGAGRTPTEQILLWCVIMAVSIGGFLRLRGPDADRRTPDEITYAEYADTLVARGVVAGTRRLADAYVGDPSSWVYPPPTRIGYTIPLSWATRIRGESTAAGVGLARLASVLGLILAALLAWRHVGPWGSFFTTVLLATCPLDLAMARRTWQDGLVGTGSAALVALGLVAVYPPRNRSLRTPVALIFGLVGAWLTIMKESGAGVLFAVMLPVSLALWARGDRRALATLVAATGAALTGAWVLAVHAAGGLAPLLGIYEHIGATLSTSAYNIAYQSGPLGYAFQGIWLLAPFSAVCFALGIVGALPGVGGGSATGRRPGWRTDPRSPWVTMALAVLTVAWAVAVGLPPYLKNLRFFSPALVPMYVVAGAGLGRVLEGVRHRAGTGSTYRWVAAALVCLVSAGAYIELQSYRRVTTANDFPDLTLPFIREGRAPER